MPLHGGWEQVAAEWQVSLRREQDRVAAGWEVSLLWGQEQEGFPASFDADVCPGSLGVGLVFPIPHNLPLAEFFGIEVMLSASPAPGWKTTSVEATPGSCNTIASSISSSQWGALALLGMAQPHRCSSPETKRK